MSDAVVLQYVTRFSVTDADLADYKDTHTPKSKPGVSATSEDNES